MYLSELKPATPVRFIVVSRLGRTPCGTSAAEAMEVAALQVDENCRVATVHREDDPRTVVARYEWDDEHYQVVETTEPDVGGEDRLDPSWPDGNPLDDPMYQDDGDWADNMVPDAPYDDFVEPMGDPYNDGY